MASEYFDLVIAPDEMDALRRGARMIVTMEDDMVNVEWEMPD